MMVVHLPLSVFKDWICSLLKTICRKLHKDYTGLSVPLRIDETHPTSETYPKTCLIADKEIRDREEGLLLITKGKDETISPAEGCKHSSWKIAKCGLYLTPVWFASEVTRFL